MAFCPANTGRRKKKTAALDERLKRCYTIGTAAGFYRALAPVSYTHLENVETENCRVVTKFDGVIEGTAQLINASTHVNEKYADTQRTFDTVEIVLDEPVADAEDVKKLGVRTGDYVCFEPRTRVTQSGYIKSRFLDDKLSVGILLGLSLIHIYRLHIERKLCCARMACGGVSFYFRRICAQKGFLFEEAQTVDKKLFSPRRGGE